MGQVLCNRMLEMTHYALNLNPENRLVAILWHQGEHEVVFCKEPNPVATHTKNLSAVLSAIRSEFGNAPFITASFCKEWEMENAQTCELINQAIKQVVANDVNAGYVDAGDLKSNNQQCGDGDNIHFSRNSLDILAKRFYRCFEQLA